MRYMILPLFLLGGCGLFGNKDNPAEDNTNSPVSVHDRDHAECEMQALEVIPTGPDYESRVQRYARLCMQARGYPASKPTDIKVKIRD